MTLNLCMGNLSYVALHIFFTRSQWDVAVDDLLPSGVNSYKITTLYNAED